MYKYKYLLAYCLIMLVIIGFAAYQLRPTPVPQPALALSGDDQGVQSLLSQTNTDNTMEDLPSVHDAAVLSQEVQSLLGKRQSEVLQGAEWIHVVELHQRNKETAGSLPTGQQILLNYVLETWYHLDGEGNVLELVSIMKSESNEIVQVSTYKDALWQNLTVGETWQGDPPTLNLDYGFSNDLAMAPSWGSTVNREENMLSDGTSALVFSIRDKFDQPTKIEGYEKLIIRGETRVHFDAQSGALLSWDRIFVDENGEQFYSEQMKIQTFEKSDPPPNDVLKYLEGVVK